jgi:ATP-dependent HslUV protease subunit HslV
MHGTTVLAVRHRGAVVIVADGQISMGSKVVKANARKLRRLLPMAAPAGGGASSTSSSTPSIDAAAAEDAASLPGGGLVIGGFAGSTADGLTLFERLEARLRQHPGQLRRAAVDLAKAWRQDRVLRRLRAAMLVADATGACLEISGNGDVLEPADGVHAIGSGARYALAAARALVRLDEDAAKVEGGGGADDTTKPGLFTALEIAQRAMRVASDRCVYTNDVWSWEGVDERTGEAFSGGSGGGGGGDGAGGGKASKEAA